MKTILIVVTAATLGFSAMSAHAGGWGSRHGGGSLVTVSPSVKLGNVGVANGALSGNVVSNILNGNALGILNGTGIGILGSGNTSYSLKKR
jgi:hypothetical protein